MQGLADGFDGADYQILFSQPPRTLSSQDLDILSGALPFRPAGVAFSAPVESRRTRKSLADHDIPVVEMWSQPSGAVDMAVAVAEHQSGQILGRHLGAQGYRRALFCGDPSLANHARLEGVRAGLAEAGGELASLPAEPSLSLSAAKSAFDAVLEAALRFDVLIAADDEAADGLLLRALERQYLVPDQIGVASLGLACPVASSVSVVTSLRSNGYDMGLEAGRLLRSRLEGREGGKKSEVSLQLHIGRSTMRHGGTD